MSLIIDALKKAQQLRVKGYEGAPVLRYSSPKGQRGKDSKIRWILSGIGIIVLCIVFFVLLKPASRPASETSPQSMISSNPSAGIPSPATSSEEGSSLSVPEQTSPEASEETEALPQNEEVLPQNQAKAEKTSPSGETLRPPLSRSREEKKAVQARKTLPEEKFTMEQQPASSEQQNETLGQKSVLPSPPQSVEVSAKTLGVEEEGRKDRKRALEVLKVFNSGVSFYNQKEYPKAIQAYQKVIEMDPAYVEAYNNLGILYQTLGDTDKASVFYQKAIEINPGYEKGLNNLGTLFLLNNRYDEAQKVFQKVLAINANNLESYLNLGTLYKKKGETEKAVESYRKALAINPSQKETHYNLALLYEQLGNLEPAVAHYQEFIRLSAQSNPELVSRVEEHLRRIMQGGKK